MYAGAWSAVGWGPGLRAQETKFLEEQCIKNELFSAVKLSALSFSSRPQAHTLTNDTG